MKNRKDKGDDPNQLLLEFETSQSEMKKAVDRFSAAAQALAKSHDNPETAAMVDDEILATRKVINRIVGVLADQTGLPFHTVWVLAYHELHKRTGYHAVADSAGKGTHLDAVQSAGRLDDLQDTVAGMLVDGNYTRKGAK